MANATKKIIQAYEMLKDGKPLKFDTYVKQLGCKPVSAMVLICCLRRDFGADIETIRDGRKVVAYQLNNAAAVAPKMVGKTKTKAAKAAKVAVLKTKTTISKPKTAVIEDGSVPTLDVEEIDSDAELESLKAELGLATNSYSE
jgi:hypothetical protein